MLLINGLTSIDLSFIRECECRSSSHFVYDSISLYVLRPLWSAGLSVNAADQPPAVLPMVHWLDFHHRGLRRRMQPRLCPYGVSVTLRCDPAEPRGVLEARYPLVAPKVRYIDSQCRCQYSVYRKSGNSWLLSYFFLQSARGSCLLGAFL